VEELDKEITVDYDDGVNIFSTNSGVQGCDGEVIMVQKGCKLGCTRILNPNHLYIDTCATYASTPHAHFLDNLKKQGSYLRGHTNAGSAIMTHAGAMGDLKKVWLNEGGVASVVPLKLLKQIQPVSYHSARGMNPGHFIIHSREGDIVCCNNSRGMPYLNLEELDAEVALCLIQDTIDTVRTNFEGYTKHEIEEAKQACETQGMVGHLTDREFLGMVRSQMISNCDVTPTAIKNANQIFGPNLAGVRGRTIRTAPEPVRVDYVQIPRAILDRHGIVTLAVDCMFVNGVPFLVSVSRGLNLITAEFTPPRTAKNLAAGIRNIKALYEKGGFQVGHVLMDNE
jgi:hypothetical protein